jgi:hypothetical protein
MIAFTAINENKDIGSIVIGFTKEDINNLLSGLGCTLTISNLSDKEFKCLFFAGENEDNIRHKLKKLFE